VGDVEAGVGAGVDALGSSRGTEPQPESKEIASHKGKNQLQAGAEK
jgi:hypothetical protein